MKKLLCVIALFILLLMVSSISFAVPLSPNIPLNSYIYVYLDKLEGLRYLKELQPGIKPYTRMQVAGWVRQIRENAIITDESPEYVRTIMDQLLHEFSKKLAALEGASMTAGFTVREWSWAANHYESEPFKQHPSLPYTKYHPLDSYQNGYELRDGLNSAFTVHIDAIPNDSVVLSFTPHIQLDEDDKLSFCWESAYLKTRFRNTQIQLGKDAFWWGGVSGGVLH